MVRDPPFPLKKEKGPLKGGCQELKWGRTLLSGQELVNQTSLTMSALSNSFLSTLLASLKKGCSSASYAVFRIGLEKHGSFVI